MQIFPSTLFAIDGVQNLSETEALNIDGGMLLSSCGGWLKCLLKVGGGLAAGWYVTKSCEA